MNLIRNRQGFERCGWCSNEGWLYLRRFEAHEVKRYLRHSGETVVLAWHEQQLAACGFCERGHHLHEKHGGPWRYNYEDIDCYMDDQDKAKLDEAERNGYEKMRSMGLAFAERYKTVDLAPAGADIDSYPASTKLDTDHNL